MNRGATAGSAEETAQRFAALRERHTSPVERRAVRDALVAEHLGLVEQCARRFRGRGEPWEDLVQAGCLGLIQAVDRFDPARGTAFSTFAVPTILGEIRRHFRDHGWVMHVTRRVQELRLELVAAASELTQRLGRTPTTAELAAHASCSVSEVAEALEATHAYAALSLSVTDPLGDGGESPALGVVDGDLGQAELRATVRHALDLLDRRTQRILVLRYFANRTQAEIAQELGLSQMQVSRLLAQALGRLRTLLL